ncbi:MAG: hypothetical protein LBJ62_08280 [Bifidobacteriaceae bacterium]|nr:hypothetical protein [Bifidobacteriaceae bacterium]
MEAWVRQILRCPSCRGRLDDGPGRLICPACQLAYPLRDGIPALLAGRAEHYSPMELPSQTDRLGSIGPTNRPVTA